MIVSHTNGIIPENPEIIWVFGSNLAGRHGAGAAKIAMKYFGAKYGNPEGPQGRSWAIPTKDKDIKTLPLDKIALSVANFVAASGAIKQPKHFFITSIGCGLAGYKPEEIAPMFKGVSIHYHHIYDFPHSWLQHLLAAKIEE